ncbi:hypothetical protein P872_21235 [Rhodonellum psychrophilum GCM71 = DSM 17998]|uniref:2-oxoacid dehydrogenase acyltransferase catalytic domain-containing protein n=3 Tax=Cytophagaceae TaxID=89373 RepID=U5BXV1_9BACT|nr:hypothetical protein P872_21235 [Rhodonellum psychrophilum GCM71 = DSM 17998]SDZ08059.1 2-oxoacid dehydrogenases acyltransferase (catalytic domain) [Rhodonellum ikkaensis]
MISHKTHRFPKTRMASIDIFGIGRRKHHVVALVEIDVTESKKRIKHHQESSGKITFTSWLIKVISDTVKSHEFVAAYLKGNRSLLVFEDVNVSLIVEKELNGQKIPLPLLIEKADKKSIETITNEIGVARENPLNKKDIVLQKRSTAMERFYYFLPGFIRRAFWRNLLKHPHLAFSKMGNVAITSVGMMGEVQGWFIPSSIHPICFGISTVSKKPWVIGERIEIREILHLTILLDHDVVDGAPMARFISELAENMEKGKGL